MEIKTSMTQANDPLYYRRTILAERLVSSLSDGIAHAFTLFAPRRMGKTQFLLNDITPIAKAKGFKVFYFSFMDVDNETMAGRFQQALIQFTAELTTKDKAKALLATIEQVSFMGAAISRHQQAPSPSTSDIIDTLAMAKQPILLLLDEAQELARSKDTQGLIRSLRTGLDVNKDRVKVIFTGSSITGLSALFNDSKAPFFHFAHDVDFPTLDKAFSDHLASIIEQRTGQHIDYNNFFSIFERLHRTPLYLRAIAQDMILNPNLTLSQATAQRMAQLNDTGAYQRLWNELNLMDKALLWQISNDISKPYSQANIKQLSSIVGKTVTTSQVQATIRRLTQQDIIAKDIHSNWIIIEQAFKSWITETSNCHILPTASNT